MSADRPEYTVDFFESQLRWKPHEEIEDATHRSTFQRDVKFRGRTEGVPPQEYVLAVDPQGNLVRMAVRSNELNPYDPNKASRGADRTSFKADTIRRKVYQSGWIMADVENVPDKVFSDGRGHRRPPTIEEKRAHWTMVAAEAEKRRAAHDAEERKNAERRKPDSVKAIEAARESSLEAKAAAEQTRAVLKRSKAKDE